MTAETMLDLHLVFTSPSMLRCGEKASMQPCSVLQHRAARMTGAVHSPSLRPRPLAPDCQSNAKARKSAWRSRGSNPCVACARAMLHTVKEGAWSERPELKAFPSEPGSMRSNSKRFPWGELWRAAVALFAALCDNGIEPTVEQVPAPQRFGSTRMTICRYRHHARNTCKHSAPNAQQTSKPRMKARSEVSKEPCHRDLQGVSVNMHSSGPQWPWCPFENQSLPRVTGGSCNSADVRDVQVCTEATQLPSRLWDFRGNPARNASWHIWETWSFEMSWPKRVGVSPFQTSHETEQCVPEAYAICQLCSTGDNHRLPWQNLASGGTLAPGQYWWHCLLFMEEAIHGLVTSFCGRDSPEEWFEAQDLLPRKQLTSSMTKTIKAVADRTPACRCRLVQ